MVTRESVCRMPFCLLKLTLQKIIYFPVLIKAYSEDGLSSDASSKNPACWCRRHKRLSFDRWAEKILWRRKWQPTPATDRGAWPTSAYGVTQSQTWLKRLSVQAFWGHDDMNISLGLEISFICSASCYFIGDSKREFLECGYKGLMMAHLGIFGKSDALQVISEKSPILSISLICRPQLWLQSVLVPWWLPSGCQEPRFHDCIQLKRNTKPRPFLLM